MNSQVVPPQSRGDLQIDQQQVRPTNPYAA
jgi:hypothetical protein